jgi:hypothetical protein
MEPGNADPVAGAQVAGRGAGHIGYAHHLMAGDEGPLLCGQVSLDDVQVRMAEAADRHPQAQLPGARFRVRHIRGPQRRGLYGDLGPQEQGLHLE